MPAGQIAGDQDATALEWDDALPDRVVSSDTSSSLLRRAAARAPDNAAIRVNLGTVLLERYAFAEAADAFGAALRIDPFRQDARLGLARCWNRMGRHEDVLALIDDTVPGATADARYQRGMAAAAMEQTGRAEQEFRAALDRDVHHREACFELGRILRRSGRLDALAALSAALWERGARHVQLLLDRGRALESAGELADARDLLFTEAMVTRTTLETPHGFATLADFNAAVGEELAGNPLPLTNLPADELAIRGGIRVNQLMSGARPELIRTLIDAIKTAIGRDLAGRAARTRPDDPWLACRPARASLRAWANIQDAGAYEDWHAHRAGWLSGVYYVEVPEAFSVDGDGAGCIEFGAPPSLAERLPDRLRVAPRAGMLLLMPSHVNHRTIPFATAGRRISFAFDVRPARDGQHR